jgi:hypothetical protein
VGLRGQVTPILVMLGHRAPVTVAVQATVEAEYTDGGLLDVVISASEDGHVAPVGVRERTRPAEWAERGTETLSCGAWTTVGVCMSCPRRCLGAPPP